MHSVGMVSLRCANQQSGFTLIELMIGLFIISILTMIALPAYNSYVVKSKITSELVHIARLKSEIVLYYSMNGRLPSSDKEVTLPKKKDFVAKYLEKISIKPDKGKTGVQVIMEFDKKKLPVLGNNRKLIYTATVNDGSISWECKKLTNIEENYRPSEC